MMEWTDRYCRFFHRLLTRRALLYTEMITTGAVLRGDRAHPLDYDRVYRLKRAWPNLHVSINGGIANVENAAAHLLHVDGVMMGRAAYQEPWRLLEVDRLIHGAPAPFASPKAALEAFIPYVE